MKKCLLIFSISFVTTDLFSQIVVQNDILTYLSSQGSAITGNGDVKSVFSGRDNTEGNRYLFDKPVDGKVFATDSNIVNTEGFVFNYDKMGKKLIAVKDGKTIIEVNTEHIKSFILIDDNQTDSFVRLPAIKKEFFIQIAKGKKYSFYKTIQTKFQPADFFTNGIIERGNNYDSYIDKFEYYVVFSDGKYKKLELKRKSLKNTFINEEKKLKRYFKASVDQVGGFVPITESYVKGLVNYLNH